MVKLLFAISGRASGRANTSVNEAQHYAQSL